MVDMIDAGRLIRLAEYAAGPRPNERHIQREMSALATGRAECGMVIAGLTRGASKMMISSGMVARRDGEGYYVWTRIDDNDEPLAESAEVATQILVAYLNDDTPMAHALITAVTTRSREFVDAVIGISMGFSTVALKEARRAAA